MSDKMKDNAPEKDEVLEQAVKAAAEDTAQEAPAQANAALRIRHQAE